MHSYIVNVLQRAPDAATNKIAKHGNSIKDKQRELLVTCFFHRSTIEHKRWTVISSKSLNPKNTNTRVIRG